ncbi:hypothetical protein TPHA_0I01220 [Tetrapisispora phaffii CBS 4417]|uniref:Large ribosomal subunit protein bL17m C-terminal fungi domain-containing protein n=1 Tax=Tetrapisispora phaffii (strain ATCC 24235 / CBS 4417 / NBRC 1672 / NRRL Y-8282 / UCD 70-5) TaxID=1071381 RepID=G8BXK0_TETPH|nr:hypothetical protein TPHA_0I01220 [Tetrapisispora phaffii CBS 4417]CCE64628.1 hypothetical protein TPHA_0I01220 [Tetrapisispora phaffii CBS 4417]
MTKGLARKLSRTKAHRTALLKNLVSDLFQHGSIVSTHEKCMEARTLAERVVSMCNKDIALMKNDQATLDTVYRRNIQSRLFLSGDNSKLLKKVYSICNNNVELQEKARKSGFTRVLHLEPRLNDGARQSILELVDYPVIDTLDTDTDAVKLHRGNIKLWLLVKTVLYNEAHSLPHDQLTLKNLHTIAAYKTKEAFAKEIGAIRSVLLQEIYNDKPIVPEQETKTLDALITQIYNYTKPEALQRRGFQVMQERPPRSI